MLFKYSMLQTLKKPSRFFWSLLFPMVLGTFYYIAFGQSGTNTWSNIPVAVVEVAENEGFSDFLEEMEDSYLEPSNATDEEALELLEAGEVDGIYYVDEEPSCTIQMSGTNQTILTEILSSYLSHSEMIENILEEHPENIQTVLDAMEEDMEYTIEVSLGGKSYDNTLNYFFALIAMACFFGSFLGNELAEENSANKTSVGARRCVSPLPKTRMVLTDMLCGIIIQFICIVILLLYLDYILGVSFSGNMGGMLLICFLGSLTGVCFGIALGCSSRIKKSLKDLLLVVVPLLTSFLAGLMAGGIKDSIEKACPIINRINPATLVSDAFYCLIVYDDTRRLITNLVTLAAISAVLLIISVLSMRRVRYDHI